MPKTEKKTLYRFPENMKLFVVALIACNFAVNNFHCNDRQTGPVCPVEYETATGDFSLHGKWRFIGFENQKTKNIEYPPCGDNETFLILTDSLHRKTDDNVYQYPYIFQGRTLINSFVGSYVIEADNRIRFSETIKSRINGTPELAEFQDKFHNCLSSAERFEINENLLMIYFSPGGRDMLFVAQNDTILF